MKIKKIFQLFGLSIAIVVFLFFFLVTFQAPDPTLGIVLSSIGLTIFSCLFYGYLFDKWWIK
jgi:hypothetical protein